MWKFPATSILILPHWSPNTHIGSAFQNTDDHRFAYFVYLPARKPTWWRASKARGSRTVLHDPYSSLDPSCPSSLQYFLVSRLRNPPLVLTVLVRTTPSACIWHSSIHFPNTIISEENREYKAVEGLLSSVPCSHSAAMFVLVVWFTFGHLLRVCTHNIRNRG